MRRCDFAKPVSSTRQETEMNDTTTKLLNDIDGRAEPDAMEPPPFLDRTKRKSWRDVLKIHPACEKIPPMSAEELQATGENIQKHGLQFPIAILAANGSTELLDGRSRLDSMEAAGILRIAGKVTLEYKTPAGEWGKVPVTHLPASTNPYEYALSANIHRRHLTADDKRKTIEAILKAAPEKSNLAIAKTAKVSDKTVSAVRAKLEATSEIPKLEKTTGADGKARPAKRKRRSLDDFEAEKRAREKAKAADAEPEAEIKPVRSTPVVTEVAAEAPQPEPTNPIAAAWEKATEAQRTEFVHAYIADITKLFETSEADDDEPEPESESAKKRRAKPKLIERKASLTDVLSEAFEELAELGNEMREAFDATPESLQQSGVGQAREAAADALECIEAPDVPAELAGVQVTWSDVRRPRSRYVSRAMRRDDATAILTACVSALSEIADNESNPQDLRDEASNLCAEIEGARDEADYVDFPSMYG